MCNIITERKIYIMKNLAYVTLLIESNNEDDFESKSNDGFDDTTWSQLDNLLEPSYTVRGTLSKTAIHFDEDSSQHKKVRLTQKASISKTYFRIKKNMIFKINMYP